MPDDIVLAPLSDVDDARLADFAAAVWGENERHEAARKWWRTSAFASVLAATAGEGGPMAALCVGVPSAWRLPDGTDVNAVSICGWYVHPAHAGRGLGQWLVQSFDNVQAYNALSISDTAVRGFARLGWTGPSSTFLRLLPLPVFRKPFVPRLPPGWSWRTHRVAGADLPMTLAEALDRINANRPPHALRRRRTAADWRAHLAARPARRPTFVILSQGERPVGYAIVRSSDQESGAIYRRARLHFVSDLVINQEDDASIDALLGAVVSAAPAGAGALLLCTSWRRLADRARTRGWLHENSPLIGRSLEAKAPRYMLGGAFRDLLDREWQLTFADSDVDLNI